MAWICSIILFLAGGLGVVRDQVAYAKSPVEMEKPVRTDQFGDLLPTGAIVRCGTNRLRHDGAVYSVKFTPDGKSVVSAGEDQTIRVWDKATGKELLRLEGHEGEVTGIAVSPDGKLIASQGPNAVLIWDLATGKKIDRLDCISNSFRQNSSLVFSQDGNTLASTDRLHVVLWDVATGRELNRFESKPDVRSVSYGADGKTLAFLSAGAVCVRNP